MNCVILVGRLTKDPETRYSQSGVAVCNFSLAVDRQFKRDGDPSADFIDCVSFGKTGEFTEKYFKKGMRVSILGRLQIDQYEAKDGTKRRVAKVVVDRQEFAQSKSENDSPALSGSEQTYKPPVEDDGFLKIPDSDMDELPFV